jgi:hypothetical protein
MDTKTVVATSSAMMISSISYLCFR